MTTKKTPVAAKKKSPAAAKKTAPAKKTAKPAAAKKKAAPAARPPAAAKAKGAATASGFNGFADTTGKFFAALAKHQDRAWFQEHKAEYEQGWAAPMEALLGEVRERIDAIYEDVDLADAKLFRIHRDVRFSADKSPYKTHVAGLLGTRPGRAVMEAPAALYFHVGAGELTAVAGYYVMPKDALAAFRIALLDEARGSELAKIVKALEKKGYTLGAGDSLKRVPPGVDPAHPRAHLLVMKGLMASFPPFDAALLKSRALVDELVRRCKETAPLVTWLVHATA